MHPSSNPAETFMKPLGKAMKVAKYDRISEKSALQNLLNDCRDTPHPATGVPPASILFRDGMNGIFPRRCVTEIDVKDARKKDSSMKRDRQDRLNASKFCSNDRFLKGETALLRNYRRTSKFDTFFSPEKCEIMHVSNGGKVITVQRKVDGNIFKRHPDDLKRCVAEEEYRCATGESEWEALNNWHDILQSGNQHLEEDIGEKEVVGEGRSSTEYHDEGELESIDNATHVVPRRSARERRPNPRYYNDNVQTY